MSEEKKNLHKSRSVQLGQGDCFSDYNCSALWTFYYSECGCTYRIDGNNDPCRIQDHGTSIVLRF